MKSEAMAQNQKMNVQNFVSIHNVLGRFGFDEVTECGVTFGMNPKAGMDSEEFTKYLLNAIVPLYPDAKDEPGKRVAIVVDSGPGRVNTEMLAQLRLKGFYLVPGVPNTTHVTQVTDRNYGPFKTVYRRNLSKLTRYRHSRRETISANDIPLLVFGGLVDGNNIGLESAFKVAFGFERNIDIWRLIGISPFTRECLRDEQVRHDIMVDADGIVDVDADPLTEKLLQIELLNKGACCILDEHGCDGQVFRKDVLRVQSSEIAVTAPHSRERKVCHSGFYVTHQKLSLSLTKPRELESSSVSLFQK